MMYSQTNELSTVYFLGQTHLYQLLFATTGETCVGHYLEFFVSVSDEYLDFRLPKVASQLSIDEFRFAHFHPPK